MSIDAGDKSNRVIVLRPGEATVLGRALSMYQQFLRNEAQKQEQQSTKQYLLQKAHAVGALSDRIIRAPLDIPQQR